MDMALGSSMGNNDYQCRVLVVDDNEPTRKLLKTFLQGFGAKIVGEAADGEEAVRVFHECKPDLTFLDLEMPVKNGKDVLREIIEKDPTAHVVIVTATSELKVANWCADAGAQNYIRKGVSPGVLKLMLKAQLDLCEAC